MEDRDHHRGEQKTVCGSVFQDHERFPSAIYKGVRVYFCTVGCLRVFELTPDAFMRGEVEHPLEDD